MGKLSKHSPVWVWSKLTVINVSFSALIFRPVIRLLMLLLMQLSEVNQHPSSQSELSIYGRIYWYKGLCGGCLWSVCCWWLVYSLTWPESDWLDSGWVGLHTCGAWAIMAPRINQPSTHTLEEEPQSWPVYHQLGEYNQPAKLQINILYYIYPCPVSEGPKRSHLGGVWRRNPATACNY